MINLFPEPKVARELEGRTRPFGGLAIDFGDLPEAEKADLLDIARMRFWNRRDLRISADAAGAPESDSLRLTSVPDLSGIEAENRDLFIKQGYYLKIEGGRILLKYQGKSGFIYAITTLKQLLVRQEGKFILPRCEITDWPSVEHRAVAPTFSWYAGYGRLGFDMQLWGRDAWVEYLNTCIDSKINQMNMVMYGYWPFEFEEYPETVFRDVPVKIWNKENRRWASTSLLAAR